MKHLGSIITLVVAAGSLAAAELKKTDLSVRNEVQRAIDKGLVYLKTSQNSNGWWSTPDHPSVTALALSAFMGEPQQRYASAPHVKKGYAFVVSCAKPDGGIYVTNLANYNTSISMMGLLAARDAKYDDLLRRARAFVIGGQVDTGEKNKADSPWDGGVGYSHDATRSDMNNTLVALEALYYSKHLATDQKLSEARDLNWAAALHFIQTCQNLPGTNAQAWAATDPRDRGGFVYDPESTKSQAVTNAAGKVALRSYGSISYAGLLSYIYADVKRNDPRVDAVMDWLKKNYSLTENPGMGQQGYYYYLHLMTKALTAAGVDTLDTANGKVDWRREVALRLIDLQKADGSFQNETGRWWEKDPALVTSYAVLSLEMVYRGI
jgi:squalene-hopene/tetraprenyl-beta-curcumene cyclase